MTSMREVMAETIALERRTMAVYAGCYRAFSTDPRLRDFWFAMARDEAGHVGALELVSTVLEVGGLLDKPSPVSLDDASIGRARELLDVAARDAAGPVTIERALTIAVEIEESEIEDLVSDLLAAVQDEREQRRYQRLLVHDLGDLSYMIEQYCQDRVLLQRCDTLVNSHAEALRLASAH
jgi:rubrerythrin